MVAHESDRPVAMDSTGLSLSWRTVVLTLAWVVAVVVAVVSVFPFLLSKKVTVATESYVDGKVGGVAAAQTEKIAGIRVEIQSLASQVAQSTEGVTRIEGSLTKQRASQEAERVTQVVKSSDERLRVYQRVYEANLKRLARGEDPVKPQDVEDYR
jgi:hypothetical protein